MKSKQRYAIGWLGGRPVVLVGEKDGFPIVYENYNIVDTRSGFYDRIERFVLKVTINAFNLYDYYGEERFLDELVERFQEFSEVKTFNKNKSIKKIFTLLEREEKEND